MKTPTLHLYKVVSEEDDYMYAIVAPSEYFAFHTLAKWVRDNFENEAISRDIYPVRSYPYTWYDVTGPTNQGPVSTFCRFKLVECALEPGVIDCGAF